MNTHFEVLIVGGGTGGITTAARLLDPQTGTVPGSVGLVEPSDTHYYQPLWTLVGGGVLPKEETARPQADLIPSGATWIRDAVRRFEPEARQVHLAGGGVLTYDQLVVALGLQVNWDGIPGLRAALGHDGVCSNYSYETVDGTWAQVKAFQGGRAIFTFPDTPVKCGGAPQKIMWLVEHHLQREGLRARSEVAFHTPGARIFGIDKYAKALEKLVVERDIRTHFGETLVEVRGPRKEAIFRVNATGVLRTVPYELLHVTPPMGPVAALQGSVLGDAGGWVEVDRSTLQHVRFPEVFALGDASSLPTAKTGAAIRKQAPVLVENLRALRARRPLTAHYDGYTSCPLVTGYGRLILAEFDYEGRPAESFPFDQAQERFSMYQLKRHLLPALYWHGMLRGRA